MHVGLRMATLRRGVVGQSIRRSGHSAAHQTGLAAA